MNDEKCPENVGYMFYAFILAISITLLMILNTVI